MVPFSREPKGLRRHYLVVAAVTILLCLSSFLYVAGSPAAGTDITGTIPLSISKIAFPNITSSEVTVTWTTNAIADSQVMFDTKPREQAQDYSGRSAILTTPVTEHLLVLTGLSPDTVYYLRIISIAVLGEYEFLAVSAEYSLLTLADEGGEGGGSTTTTSSATTTRTTTTTATGGSGGPEDLTMSLALDGASSDGDVILNLLGQTQKACTLVSADGLCHIDILKYTYLRDARGKPLTGISISPIAAPPDVPPGFKVIAAYDLGPDGARFNPAITIMFTFDPQILPAGTVPGDLKVAVWDSSGWQVLAGDVDISANTIAVNTLHFSDFVLLRPAQEAQSTAVSLPSTPLQVMTTATTLPESTATTVTTTPLPLTTVTVSPTPFSQPQSNDVAQAVITLSDLKVVPSRVKPGEPVEISLRVAEKNTQGSFTVILLINGVYEDRFTVGPSENGSVVSFTVSRDIAGDYTVEVEGLTGVFTVAGSALPRWLWWVAGSFTVLAGVVLAVVLWSRRRLTPP